MVSVMGRIDTVRGGETVELWLKRDELFAAVTQYMAGLGWNVETLRLDPTLRIQVDGVSMRYRLHESGAYFFGHMAAAKGGVSQAKPADDSCKPLEPLREADVVAIVERVLKRFSSEDPAYTPRLWSHARMVDAARSVLVDSGLVAGKPSRDATLAGLGSPEAAERDKQYNDRLDTLMRAAAEASRDDVVKYLRHRLKSAEAQVSREVGLKEEVVRRCQDAVQRAEAVVAAETRRRETTEERLETLQGINCTLWARNEALALRLVEVQSRWEESQDKLQDAREVIAAHEERERQLERRAEAAEKLAAERAAANDDLGCSLADSQTKLLDARRQRDDEARVHREAERELMRKVDTEKKRADEAEQEAQVSRNVSIALRQRAEAAEASLRAWEHRWRDTPPLQRPPHPTLSPDAAQVARDALLDALSRVIVDRKPVQLEDLARLRRSFLSATKRDVLSGGD